MLLLHEQASKKLLIFDSKTAIVISAKDKRGFLNYLLSTESAFIPNMTRLQCVPKQGNKKTMYI